MNISPSGFSGSCGLGSFKVTNIKVDTKLDLYKNYALPLLESTTEGISGKMLASHCTESSMLICALFIRNSFNINDLVKCGSI